MAGGRGPKNRGYDQQSIIKKFKETHGDSYDYSDVVFKTVADKVIIKCPKHGSFEQVPSAHLRGVGCPKCKSDKLSDLHSYKKDEWIKKAEKIHNSFYGYNS